MKKLIRLVLSYVPRKYIQRVAHIVTPMLGVFYRGNKVECPVCGAHYDHFMPYGYVVSRENALCPSCMALERHRLLWLYLERESGLFSSSAGMGDGSDSVTDSSTAKKVLHVAPERCFISRLEKRLGLKNYITADLESPLARVKANIEALPFENSSFDLVICNHILEHVDNDIKALSEIFRVLRPRGRAILMCPINYEREKTYEDPSIVDPLEREKHFGQKDHLREYGRDYPQRIEKVGFRAESIDYIKTLNNNEITRYGLRSEIIYIGSKA